VIDVSDDEGSQDEDDAMDLDSNQNSPARSSRSLSDQRSHPSTDSATRPRQPPKKLNSLNSTVTSTSATPLSFAKTALVRPAALQRKESEIEELKRRIAQAEARNKAKQTPSGTQTPVSILANATRILTPTPRGSDENGSFELPSAALNLDNNPTIYTPDLQTTEKVSTAHSNITKTEQVAGPEELARQEVLLRSNDYEELNKKLENIKAEMASIEAAAQEARKLMNTAKEKELRLKAQKELKMKLQSQLEARAAALQSANAGK
jgi:DNA repair exonuclease SbcCD ATPase subunit